MPTGLRVAENLPAVRGRRLDVDAVVDRSRLDNKSADTSALYWGCEKCWMCQDHRRQQRNISLGPGENPKENDDHVGIIERAL